MFHPSRGARKTGLVVQQREQPAMKHSTDRILTTHTGSLPRPHALLDLMKARVSGESGGDARYDARLRAAGGTIVREQIAHGVDVVTDGEQSKLGFSAYVGERLAGFE